MSAVLRPRTLLVLIPFLAVCLLISTPTKDTSGVEGAVSWVTFAGFWLALPITLLLAVVLVGRRLAGR